MPVPSARLRNAGKQYEREAWALRGVTLDVEAGGITALIGANGSGKSTLLQLLSGALPCTEGEVELFGRPAATYRSAELRRRVGLVAQDAALDPDMTAEETLRFFAALYAVPSAIARTRITGLMTAFALEPIRGRVLSRVSGGQRQRVHLALGLLQAPSLILFDEPANGLDPTLREAFWKMLQVFCKQATGDADAPARAAVVVTHDLGDVLAYADCVAVLSRGHLVTTGRPADLLAQTGTMTLADAYAALTGETLGQRGGGRMPGRGRRT